MQISFFLHFVLSMQHRAPSFFDLEQQFDKIYALNNFLPKLKQIISWELFRPTLNQIHDKERLSNAGRKSFDVILMFKILVLQTIYNLGIEQMELQIRDRLSFRDFLDLEFADTVPDAKTIWLFAEQLKQHGIEQQLFDRFHQELEAHGFGINSGLIVDSTFVEVPRQHNTREENEQIKRGEVPERFAKNPHVASQKDTDATYSYKNNEEFFGYEDHVLIDDEHKFIRSYGITTAKAHELSVFLDLVPDEPEYGDQEVFADSAYWGKEYREKLSGRGFLSFVHERGCGKKKLTEEQRLTNKVKSSVRSRVEHVFGAMWVRRRDGVLRTVGLGRAIFWIGMRNLAYNFGRLVSIPKKQAKGV